MDLSTGSIGWHRTRQWLDDEIERAFEAPNMVDGLTSEQNEFRKGYFQGMFAAYGRVRQRFNTPEESVQAEKARREMFG